MSNKLKRAVRARMQSTGENYTTARWRLLRLRELRGLPQTPAVVAEIAALMDPRQGEEP